MTQKDPLAEYIQEKYYIGKATVGEVAKSIYSSQEMFDKAINEAYTDLYSDKYKDVSSFKDAYIGKYGNPFASKKKVESEALSQESLAPDPPMDFQMPEPNQSFADLQQGAEPRSVLEQQVGATLEGATIYFDHPTATSSTASKVQQAREERGFGERLLEAGKFGLSKLVTMTSKIPRFMDEINYGGRIMENINKQGIEKRLMAKFDAGELTEEEVIKARKQAYDKNPFITNKLKDGILDAVDKNALVESLNKFEKDYEEYQAEMSQSITQSLKQGNFKEAGMQTAVSVVESLPITLAAAFTGGTGLGLISMGTSAEKSAELEEEAPDMPESAQKLNAILTGFSEGMSELITLGIGKQTMKAFIKESGEEAVKEAVSNTVKKGLLETAGKVASKTYVEEGLSEFGNTIAQNTIDWATGKDEEANIMEGAWDALIVGGASGKLFGLAQDFANVKNKVQQKRADAKSDQIIEKSKDLTKQIIRRREKLDDSVLPAADQLVEYAAENGITDMTDAWEQYLNEQPEDVKEDLIKQGNGDDIIRIAETKAVVNESIQDTEETQQDEAQPEQTEAESQTQEAVQEQQVTQEVEQPTEEEVTADPVEEAQSVDDVPQQETQVEPEIDNTEPNVEQQPDQQITEDIVDQPTEEPSEDVAEQPAVEESEPAVAQDNGFTTINVLGVKKNVSKSLLDEIKGLADDPEFRYDYNLDNDASVDEITKLIFSDESLLLPVLDELEGNYRHDIELNKKDGDDSSYLTPVYDEIIALQNAANKNKQEQVATTEPDVQQPTNTKETLKQSSDPVHQELGNVMEKMGAFENITVEEGDANGGDTVDRKGLGATMGGKTTTTAKIVIDDQAINEMAKERGMDAAELRDKVMIHEAAHTVTMQGVFASRDISKQRKAGKTDKEIALAYSKRSGQTITEQDVKTIAKLDDNLEALRLKASNAAERGEIDLTGDNTYGLRNTSDFIAEVFANSRFREELNKIQDGKKTIVQKVIDAISDFIKKFGGESLQKAFGAKKGGVLESAIREGFKAMDFYAKLNAHKIDAVNNIKNDPDLMDQQKDDIIESYMALSNKRPLKIINTEKYVAKKINTIPDHQIVENVVDAFGVSETDAIEIIEKIAQRPFRPNMNTIVAAGRGETAKIFFWVKSQIKRIGRRKKSTDDTSPYLSAFDELVRLNIQDKWIGLKRYQESIKKLYGEDIDDELNAYILREQANSVTADYEMRTFEKILGKKAGEIGYRKALKGGMLYQALQDGVTWEAMNEFLYMRHAIDFNNRVDDRRAKNYQKAQDKLVDLNKELAKVDKNEAPTAYKDLENRIAEVNRIAKKYQPLSVPASGVTNQEAEQRLREIRRENPQVEVHADRIRAYLFGEYISNLRQYKLISDERIDALENGTAKDSDVVFNHYVPLKVKNENFESEFEMDSPGLGSIYDFGLFKLEGSEKNFGPEDRHDALSVMMTLAVKSKRTGEINNGLRAYGNLIKQYGSQEATVVDGMVINKTNSLGDVIPGSVRDFSGKVANAKAKITYINEKGKYSYIIFKSEQNPTYLGLKHFPKRYNKMAGTIQQAASKVNNVRRALITQWNPKFAFSNMIRDTQDAFFNSLSEQQLKNSKLKFVKNLAKAHKYMNIDRLFSMTGSSVDVSNDPTLKTFQDAWINMQMHGGAMSWGKYTHSFEEEIADIDKRVAEIEEGLSGGKKARATAMNALNRLAAFSDGIENATRLAAYVTALEMGASPQSAAAVSRDISLNFQRKGLMTSNLNLWYLFLNAGIQGAERGLRAVKKFGWVKSFSWLTGLAFANRVMMHELFAGDDEEKKKQVEALIYDPYVSANKSIFAAPWMDKPIMFNKPYSFMRVFFGLGEGLADLMYEYKTPLDIASDMGANVLTAVDPIGGTTGSLTAFIPSEPLRAAFQLGMNEQWNGSPILYSMAAEDNTLLKEKYSKNTNKTWVAAAKLLYDNTGADWIAPAYMEYIMDKEINIGVLKEGAGMVDEFTKAYGGEEGKRLTEMAEQLMINMAKLKDENGELLEVESKKFNKYRAYPTVKLFYSPRDPEKVMLGNFINILYKGASFANTPAGGLSTGEMNYLKEGYDLVRREELLNPSMLSRRMNNMIEKFPDEDWGWYDSAKAYWD